MLNLGVSGYGPDQAFLYYEDFPHAADLDVVFYLFCNNDVRNIYENGLFHLDASGALARNSAFEPAGWVSWLRGFHMTYLVIDGARRLSLLIEQGSEYAAPAPLGTLQQEEHKGRFKDDRAMSILADIADGTVDGEHAQEFAAIFQSLLRAWREAVEERGARFVVVVLPIAGENRMSALIPQELEVVNLFECFNEHVAEYEYAPPWNFSNDYHWAEQGNMLSAVCLQRFLEREMKLQPLSADGILEELYGYYSAFAGWMPPGEWRKPTGVDPQESAAIRDKYLGYEYDLLNPALRSDVSLVARSTWDLYLGEDRLIYFKEPCAAADTEATFFLHVIPANVDDLPGARRQHGFDNLDFSFDNYPGRRFEETCSAAVRLPQYDIAGIRAGQFVLGEESEESEESEEEGEEYIQIWQEEFAFRR